MADPALQAFTAQGVYRAGVAVTFQRLTAAGVVTASAQVTALVRNALADTTGPAEAGYSTSKPDAITQEDRQIIVMSADLAALGFPLPLQKTDRVLIPDATGEVCEVIRIDPYKRALAGAIEIVATGA
jgi:hypothetical protein